jgi:hypothetical protein
MFIGLERFEAAHAFRSAMSMTITLEKKFGIQNNNSTQMALLKECGLRKIRDL